jgi:hypothetical protein
MEISDSAKKRLDKVVLQLANQSSTKQNLSLFDMGVASSQSIIVNQYRFVTPYVSSYAAGNYRIEVDGTDYAGAYGSTITPTALAALLTALGQGTWYVDEDADSGNTFYVNSNTKTYTELELTTGSAGTITLISNNNVVLTTLLSFTGTSGKSIVINWGDSNSDSVALSATTVAKTHTYSVAGTYTITITGQVDYVTLLDGSNNNLTSIVFTGTHTLLDYILLTTNQLTVFTITASMVNVTKYYLGDNAINTTNVNALLVAIDAFGTSGGQIYVDGGTNGAPSGAGAIAKTNLLGRGWTVSTN